MSLLDTLNHLQWARPMWFLSFIPLGILWGLLLKAPANYHLWQRVVAAHLLPSLLVTGRKGRLYWPYALLAAWSLAIIILAGPHSSTATETVYQPKYGRVIVLDLSTHMLSDDLKPSRLAIAHHKLRQILRRSAGLQTALIVFAQHAYRVVPLTDDSRNIATQIHALTPDIIPEDGHHLQRALTKALALLEQGQATQGDIVLLTSQYSHTKTHQIASCPFPLRILGIGTPKGAPQRTLQGNFLYDAEQRLRFSQLPLQALQQLAHATQGTYVTVTHNTADLEQLLPPLTHQADKMTEKTIQTQQDLGPRLLLLLLCGTALIFRRGWLLLSFIWILPHEPLYALPTALQHADVYAMQQFQDGDYKRAAQYFTQPDWQGLAAYRAGQYEQALQHLEGLNTPTSLYNLGLAYAQQGRLQDALTSFAQVLEQEPTHEDARFNHEVLRKWLDEHPQPSEPPPPPCADCPQDNNHAPQKRAGDTQKTPTQSTADNTAPPTTKASNESAPPSSSQQTAATQQDVAGKTGQEAPLSASPQMTAHGTEDPPSPSTEALSALLHKIPDDPGGLLKAKIYNQHVRQQQDPS